DRADLEHAEEGGGELDRVAEADEHALFDADTHSYERVADLIGQRLHFLVGVAAAIVDHRHVIAAALLDARVEKVVGHVEALGEIHWFDHLGASRRRRPLASRLTSGSSSAARSHSLQVTCLWR